MRCNRIIIRIFYKVELQILVARVLKHCRSLCIGVTPFPSVKAGRCHIRRACSAIKEIVRSWIGKRIENRPLRRIFCRRGRHREAARPARVEVVHVALDAVVGHSDVVESGRRVAGAHRIAAKGKSRDNLFLVRGAECEITRGIDGFRRSVRFKRRSGTPHVIAAKAPL